MTVNPPRRLQRSRKKGARLPEGTLCVDRSTKWGNIFWNKDGLHHVKLASGRVALFSELPTQAQLVERHRLWIVERCAAIGHGERAFILPTPPSIEEIKAELGGRDLACWCRLCPEHREHGKPFGESCPDCAPCHGDTLGALANGLERHG